MPVGESEGMTLVNRQGLYGEQLVTALAASSGLVATKRNLDQDGIDVEIGWPGFHGTRKHPAIGIQVKTWSNPRLQDSVWRYPLRVKNFNDLAGKDYDYPRFLFLVIVPHDPLEWLSVSHKDLRFSQAIYWQCLHDRDRVDRPSDSSVTIDVERDNLVDGESLLGLFADAYRKKLRP